MRQYPPQRAEIAQRKVERQREKQDEKRIGGAGEQHGCRSIGRGAALFNTSAASLVVLASGDPMCYGAGMIEAASRGWRPYALLALLCLGLYLPGLASLPVTDRDEARFAQATRQMLESGDYLRIRFQDEARNKKPAAIYWLQAASVAMVSDAASAAIWPYRVPSLLGALGAVLATFAFGARLMGRPAALLGAALLASSLALTVEAHLAKTDAVLLFTAVLAQGALGEIYRAAGLRTARWALLFWVAEAVATLVKGPVVPGLALLTMLALAGADRESALAQRAGTALGRAVVRAVGGAVVRRHIHCDGRRVHRGCRGPGFLRQVRVGAREPRRLARVLPLAAAGHVLARLVAAGFCRYRRLARARRSGGALSHRVDRAVLVRARTGADQAAALSAAGVSRAGAFGGARPVRRRDRVPRVAAARLVRRVGGGQHRYRRGAGAGAVRADVHRSIDAAGAVAGVVILGFGAATLRVAWRGVEPALAVRTALIALLVLPVALALEAPGLDPIWLSRDAALMVARYRPPPGIAIAAVGYAEPSLRVPIPGTRTVLASPEDAAERLTAARGAVALVEGRSDDALSKRRCRTAAGRRAASSAWLESIIPTASAWFSPSIAACRDEHP